MKVPVNWLRDYVDININTKELCDILTLTGSKVEEIITNGDEILNVVVSQVVKVEKHEAADKLFVCQANVGNETLQIVTAATNMKENDKIPLALHGAKLHGGKEIKRGKLRGVLSNGMFCSCEELGLLEDGTHGLMILPNDAPIGCDIKDYLRLNSEVIDFEITSNRPDCLSIIGIARETSANIDSNLRYPDTDYTPNSKENLSDTLKIEIRNDLCRRYIALGVKNINIKESDEFIKTRLNEAGIRAINNLVDITNFVMLEYGIPIHAFDRREIKSGIIAVDTGFEGEIFTTLDGIERKLPKNCLRIKDGENTIGLAGIMGGLNSEIKEDTKEVVIEIANFDSYNIRRSSDALALRTEASTRFEKGLDENMCEVVKNRIAHLILKYEIGDVMEGVIDVYEKVIHPSKLKVSRDYINRFLGIDIPCEKMKEYLDKLELKTEISEDNLLIDVPTFRRDIALKEDIAEEVARMYGYNNIPKTYDKVIITTSGENFKQKFMRKLEDTLIGCGLNQAINYPFVSPKCFDKLNIPKNSSLRDAIVIKNPLGEDYSIMRTTSLCSILEGLSRNYARNNKSVRLFEIGKRYLKQGEKLPNEVNTLTIGMYGNGDFYNLKGIIETIIETFKIRKETYDREINPSFHPGKTAALIIKGKNAGVFGEIHPDVLKNYDIDTPCFVAEINLDILLKNIPEGFKYITLPKYPATQRDISFMIAEEVLSVKAKELIYMISDLIENVTLIDVYRGSQIPNGKKSVTFSISYRSSKKTLTDEEINIVHNKVVKSVENKFNAELR